MAQTWEDYTSKIVNPSFETSDAFNNLKDTWNSTVDGWTITPKDQPANSQVGVANASTTGIQGIGSSFSPSDGNNYLYFRCNWQKDTEFKATQTISGSSQPVGLYKLTCKVANFTSNYSATQYKLTLSDGTNTATNSFAYSKQAWSEQSVIFYKSDASTELTIEAYMKPGASATGQHYCMLLDDFKLEYLSDEELEKATDANPMDMTAAISNPNIYTETRTSIAKGWTSLSHTAGNTAYSESTGDTQLEGWSEKAMNVNYVQTLKNLPNGKYILKAKVHDSNDVGAVLYATSGDVTNTADMTKDYSIVSTDAIEVSDNSLQIGIKVESANGTWMTGDDFTLTYINNTIEKLTSSATTLLSDESYKCITGEERTALEKAVATPTVTGLKSAISTFENAKASYQALVDTKALEQDELDYASANKYTTFTTAKNCAAATSATDAAEKANAIIAARRAYVESNGKAEGVEGTEDYTSKVVNADFADGLNGWTSGPATDSEVRTLSAETWTNADGTKGGAYFNYWNGSANNQHIWQDVAGLAAGKYIVTVKARGTEGFWMKLRINNEDATSIDAIGNTGGTFDRGWNDYTAEFTVSKNGTVRIDVGNYKPSGVDNKTGWFGVGDVRLVRLGDLDGVTLDESAVTDFPAGAANVTLKRTLVADKWNTLVLPFDVAADDVKALLGNDVKIVNYTNSDEENIVFNTTEEGIKANVPVLIKPAKVVDDNTYVFDGATLVEGSPIVEGTAYDFVGRYGGKYQLNLDEYMLFGDKWWKTEEGDSYSIKGFRAYIRTKALQGAAAAKSLNLVIDGQTTGLKLNTIDGTVEGEAYNLAGQRIGKSYKGIVVKNGKKMIKK